MSNAPVVVKIGGSTLGSHDTTMDDLVTLQKDGVKLVVVHGGGNVISDWMQRQGAMPRFVRGLRVTDAQALDVVTAVLTGLVNKQLVVALLNRGGKTLGLSGVDGGLLEAEVVEPELGYVGEVTRVNADLVVQAAEQGYIPLVAPVGVHVADETEYSGHILNINADTVAGEMALTLGTDRLIFLTDVEGVMDSSGRVIQSLNVQTATSLLASGVVKGGMLPKLKACLRAMERVPVTDILDGRKPSALLDCWGGANTGTRITGGGRS